MHCEELQGFLSSYIIETFFIFPPQSCSCLLVPHFPAAEEPVKLGVFLICKNYFLVMFRQSILPCCCACDWPIYKHTFCHGCYFSLMFSREGKIIHFLFPFTVELRKRGSLPAKFRFKVQSVLKLIIKRDPFISEPIQNFGCLVIACGLFIYHRY